MVAGVDQMDMVVVVQPLQEVQVLHVVQVVVHAVLLDQEPAAAVEAAVEAAVASAGSLVKYLVQIIENGLFSVIG